MYITIEQLKQHLNIEQDCNDDNLYLADLITVAEDVVRVNLNRDSLCELEDCTGLLPAGVIQAMLLLAGTYYANRESVTYGVPNRVPHGLEYLLDHYRRY